MKMLRGIIFMFSYPEVWNKRLTANVDLRYSMSEWVCNCYFKFCESLTFTLSYKRSRTFSVRDRKLLPEIDTVEKPSRLPRQMGIKK